MMMEECGRVQPPKSTDRNTATANHPLSERKLFTCKEN